MSSPTSFYSKSRKEVNSDTVTFVPATIAFPNVTVKDFIHQAATDLITLLTHPPPSTIPTLEAGDPTRNALLRIAHTLNNNPVQDSTLEQLQRQTTAAAAAVVHQDKLQKNHSTNLTTTTDLQQALARVTRVFQP